MTGDARRLSPMLIGRRVAYGTGRGVGGVSERPARRRCVAVGAANHPVLDRRRVTAHAVGARRVHETPFGLPCVTSSARTRRVRLGSGMAFRADGALGVLQDPGFRPRMALCARRLGVTLGPGVAFRTRLALRVCSGERDTWFLVAGIAGRDSLVTFREVMASRTVDLALQMGGRGRTRPCKVGRRVCKGSETDRHHQHQVDESCWLWVRANWVHV